MFVSKSGLDEETGVVFFGAACEASGDTYQGYLSHKYLLIEVTSKSIFNRLEMHIHPIINATLTL